ncbi:BQ5605_C002g01169 [Microbotryum silenes-dioicae]|uniref:BQ5605_C002g01169 protein n=1 Tax=Microbotryum silenes-dioicae TaxID=796604 RepID=A0A2X0P198_9BASI|nr:BQ5605_C002g01169 [Microbotryum silenes-dioicae]
MRVDTCRAQTEFVFSAFSQTTDTSAPGFRLLASMGWTPSSPGLGNAESQQLMASNGGSTFSKKISAIPLAKDDQMGIGAQRGAATVVRSLGGGLGSMGFVTASTSTENEGETSNATAPKTGGEFGRLLERLNKAKAEAAAASASTSASEEEPARDEDEDDTTKRKREKRERKEKKKLLKERKKLAKKDKKRQAAGEAPSEEPTSVQVESSVTVVDSSSGAATTTMTTTTTSTTILNNPRMAARSKHLRAKRMASASNAAAMAEILGIAPTPSPSASGTSTPSMLPSNGISGIGTLPSSSTPASQLAGSRSEPLKVNGPTDSGEWPKAPSRSFMPSSTGGLGSTMIASTSTLPSTFETTAPAPVTSTMTFPSFAKASTTSLMSTFEPTTMTAQKAEEQKETTEQTEKERIKKEKKEKKDKKRRRELEEKENDEGLNTPQPNPDVMDTSTEAVGIEGGAAVVTEEIRPKKKSKKTGDEKAAKKAKKEAKKAGKGE